MEVLQGGIMVISTMGRGTRKTTPRYQQEILWLRHYIDEVFAADIKGTIYVGALDQLHVAFDTVYLDPNTNASDGSSDYSHKIFRWLYRLSKEFINCLEGKESIALVILAYFTVLMRDLEEYWFMKGWRRHVMEGICRFIEERDRRWVEWPLRELDEE